MLSARLYSVETLNGFKEDPIFDPMFIKKHLGTVHSSIRSCIIDLDGADCGDLSYETHCSFYPAVYSDVYAVKWWRFNSPTRFAPIANHTPVVDFDHPVDTDSAEYLELIAVKRDELFELVKDLEVPVFPSELYDDVTDWQVLRESNAVPVEAIEDYITSLRAGISPIRDAYWRVYSDYRRWVGINAAAKAHLRKHVLVVYAAVFADILRKAFPMLCDEDFYRYTGLPDSFASFLIKRTARRITFPIVRDPEEAPRPNLPGSTTETVDTVFDSSSHFWTTADQVKGLLEGSHDFYAINF